VNQIALENVLILDAAEGKMYVYERERENSAAEDCIGLYSL